MSDKLNHYLKKWNLSKPQLLAETATSHVYTVEMKGETAVLKLLTLVGIHDERAGAIALECWAGNGAVRLFQHDNQAHLMEYIDGSDLVPIVEYGGDEEATRIIAETLNKLHSTYHKTYIGKPPEKFWTLRGRFRSLFKRASPFVSVESSSIYERAVQIITELLENPQQERILHGDIHHENIRYHSKRGWLAFDPKGIYGERTFDAANTLCNPMMMPELVTDEKRLLKNAEILAEHMKLDLSRLLAFTFAYACLSAAWSLEDDSDPYPALKVAEILERHVL